MYYELACFLYHSSDIDSVDLISMTASLLSVHGSSLAGPLSVFQEIQTEVLLWEQAF